jgi:membrane protein DedA with SNARE-associated domain
MTGIAPAVNVVCGFTLLPYREFLLFEALGEFTEVTFFAVIGYVFGSNWEYFSQLSDKFWIVIVVGTLFSFVLWRYILRKKS